MNLSMYTNENTKWIHNPAKHPHDLLSWCVFKVLLILMLNYSVTMTEPNLLKVVNTQKKKLKEF